MSKSLKERLGRVRRKAVASEELVREHPFTEERPLPWVLEAAVKGVDLYSWAKDNRSWIDRRLVEHGGILFRGFQVGGVDRFEECIAALSDGALEYKERSSPRSQVAGNIYTSTDYPPDQEIFLHNESSYQNKFPQKVFFYCVIPAETGGETPIADCRSIFERIDPEVRERFMDKGWMCVRNFGDGFGLPWESVFQTSDRDQVAEHCARGDIELEWKEDGRLRTRAVRPTVARHPKTGELVWCNHATFFHYTTLAPSIRKGLLAEFSVDDLPTNSYYGDGSPIEPEVLEQLRAAYRAETIPVPWQKGDVLMLDNLRVAHGRESFTGARKVVVGMAEPRPWSELAA